jgi:hypothetical protein
MSPRYARRMSGAVTGWLPLVFTTLGGGAVGSLIASYGSQARERRAARSEAMAFLQRFEITRGRKPAIDNDFDDSDLAELETRCLLAGMPRYLVDLYKQVNESGRYRGYAKAGSSPIAELIADPAIDEMEDLVRHELISSAAGLLASAVWHPWLTAPSRRWRAQRLRRILFRTDPSAKWMQRNHRRLLHDWEYELLNLRRKRPWPRSVAQSEGGPTPSALSPPSSQPPVTDQPH